jgi:hypothetical protein
VVVVVVVAVVVLVGLDVLVVVCRRTRMGGRR